MRTLLRVLPYLLTLVLLCTLVYKAFTNLDLVVLPPEDDHVFNVCVQHNITPEHFIRWGELDFVDNRKNIGVRVLNNPTKTSKVSSIITTTPYLYYSEKDRGLQTEYTYIFQVDSTRCSFKAIYTAPIYDDFGTMLDSGGLFILTYIPLTQTGR